MTAKFRIVNRGPHYIVQIKGWLWGWNDFFLGAWSDMPQEFSSPDEAREKICTFVKATEPKPPYCEIVTCASKH